MSILEIAYIPLKSWMEGKMQLSNIMAMSSIKNMFLDWYDTKVFMGKLQPIEKMPQEDKLEYWNATAEFPNQETRIEAVKVLYVMAYMANLKYANQRTDNGQGD